MELAITAAGGLDADHGILGGTLPSDRSPLRGNRFPEPSAYRQDRELAEAAHALAREGGLRQAAKRLGIHRDALKAAFGQWGLPALARRVGWQPTRFLADQAEAERAFAFRTPRQRQRRRDRAGDHLAVAAQSLHPPSAGHAGPQP